MTAGKPALDSAIRRLGAARAEATRLSARCDAVAGTRAEPLAQHRLSAGRAELAARKEWLHWIEEGDSLAPWADGEWGFPTSARPGAQTVGLVGRDLRSIHDRASRCQADLAQAIGRSAMRVKALERVAEAAAARRKQTQKPGLSSASKDGSNHA